MLTLERSDMRDCGEDICRMGCSTFDAISVINPSLSSFSINIEILEIIVKIDGASAEISPEDSCMRREYRCQIHMPSLSQGKSNPSKPFVKVGDSCMLCVPRNKLHEVSTSNCGLQL